MKTRPATTPEQKLAEDLALAYRGFMRGCDTHRNFDVWFYGEKLLKAQNALGFDLVDPTFMPAMIADAYKALEIAIAPHKPVALAVDQDIVFA